MSATGSDNLSDSLSEQSDSLFDGKRRPVRSLSSRAHASSRLARAERQLFRARSVRNRVARGVL